MDFSGNIMTYEDTQGFDDHLRQAEGPSIIKVVNEFMTTPRFSNFAEVSKMNPPLFRSDLMEREKVLKKMYSCLSGVPAILFGHVKCTFCRQWMK